MTEPAPASEEIASSGSGASTRAISGLFKSLTRLISSLVSIAETRLELLTTELQEEVHHTVGLVVWALIALLAAMLGFFFAGLTIVLVYWETHPIAASLLVMAAFFSLAILALLILVAKSKAHPRFLDATLTELAKDANSLKASLATPR